MPKKKRRTARARTRSNKRVRTYGRKKKNPFTSTAAQIIGAMVYGAGREYVSDTLAPITARVPAGALADEVVMGGLNYFVAKGKIPVLNKIPMLKNVAKAGLMIESARAGAYLADQFQNGMSTTKSTSTGGPLTVTVF